MDEKSGVILTGYCAEGTVAAKIKNNPNNVSYIDTVIE